jgi:DNA/RNA-binding domain of Phe-tRNA-synthetase-like protein
MRFSATPEFFALFPEARIALVVVRGIDNQPRADALLAPLLREAQASAVARLGGGALTEHARILCWREAYRAFGAKPKDYPSSIENLLRRALKGEPLRSINPLVDLYNVVSSPTSCPRAAKTSTPSRATSSSPAPPPKSRR